MELLQRPRLVANSRIAGPRCLSLLDSGVELLVLNHDYENQDDGSVFLCPM